MYKRRSSKKIPLKVIVIAIIFMLLVIGIFLVRPSMRNSVVGVLKTVTSQKQGSAVNFDVATYIDALLYPSAEKKERKQDEVILGTIAIVSDTHADYETFSTLLKKVRADDVDMVFHLGDLVEAGELDQFQQIKSILEATAIDYDLLPGDHDYNWVPQHDLRNFAHVFGIDQVNERVLRIKDYVFILYNNSKQEDSSTDKVVLLENILIEQQNIDNRGVFLLTSKPLINPYFGQKNDLLGPQILELLKKYGVKEVFSGDTHIFSRYIDDLTGIANTTVGASGDYKNPLPQYVLIKLFDSGNYDVVAKPGTDVESVD